MTGTLDSDTPFDTADYRDHFALKAARPFDSIDEFVERFALEQPAWLIRFAAGISGRDRLRDAVTSIRDDVDPALGNWKVIDRTDDSITFADDMKVMRYRLVCTLASPTELSGRTDVVQQSRVAGPIYWRLATPFHRRLFQRMLRNAGGAGSSTHAAPIG